MIQKIVVALMLVVMSLQASELHTEKSFLAALKKADKVKKPVMFIISRHTCKYCVLLEKSVLSEPAVIDALNRDFIVNISYTDDGDRFPAKYFGGGTPIIWFLNHDGKPLFQPIQGAPSLKNFQYALPQVLKEYKAVNSAPIKHPSVKE